MHCKYCDYRWTYCLTKIVKNVICPNCKKKVAIEKGHLILISNKLLKKDEDPRTFMERTYK